MCVYIHLSLYTLSLYMHIYTYTHIVALIAQWLGCQPHEAEVLGSNPHHVKLSGLEVRPLKVSGDHSKSPEQTPRTCREDPLVQTNK